MFATSWLYRSRMLGLKLAVRENAPTKDMGQEEVLRMLSQTV